MSESTSMHGEDRQRGTTKGTGETFGDDGYVHSVNCGNGFLGIYTYIYVCIYHNISNCIL